jgi:hypothetical protein
MLYLNSLIGKFIRLEHEAASEVIEEILVGIQKNIDFSFTTTVYIFTWSDKRIFSINSENMYNIEVDLQTLVSQTIMPEVFDPQKTTNIPN